MTDQPGPEHHSLDDLFAALRRRRDELKLKAHLASAEVRDELAKLEARLNELESRAAPLTKAIRESGELARDEAKEIAARIREGATHGRDDAKAVASQLGQSASTAKEGAKDIARAAVDLTAREINAGFDRLRKMLD